MKPLPIAAGFPVEGLIWFIVVILWAVAQIVNRARPKRPPSEGPGPAGMPEELKEIFETLTGQKMETPGAKPPEPAPAAPPPVPQRMELPRRTATARPQRPKASVRLAATLAAPVPATVAMAPELEKSTAVGDIAMTKSATRVQMSQVFMSTRGVFAGMKGLKFPAITQGLRTLRAERYGSPLLASADLRQKQKLRKYILGGAVLGPCKAFDYGLPR
jgi:hypothetical protein